VSQTKTKVPVRGAKVKPKRGRRPKVKVKTGPDLPLLPIAVGGILIVIAIVIIISAVSKAKAPTIPTVPAAAGIPCNQLEGTVTHYHVGLQIFYQGNPLNIPSDVGRLTTCFYWLHMHAESPGVIHIESPNKTRKFTLGDFFKVWAASKGTPEPLDATHVSTITLTPDQTLVIYIDNQDDKKGPQLYSGDPAAIPLTNSHEVITIEITPPTISPPPTFTFPSGL
jgi:hypothetical protein